MDNNITDVIVHTKESLTNHQFDELSKSIYMQQGVISLSRNPQTPQCLMLVYNSASTKARNILSSITSSGINATLVGI